VNVNESSRRLWHKQFAPEPEACGPEASLEDVLRIVRFFWSLKQEWTRHRQYKNLEEARMSVFQYIETSYNSKRIHQTLGYLTLDEFERNFRAALAA